MFKGTALLLRRIFEIFHLNNVNSCFTNVTISFQNNFWSPLLVEVSYEFDFICPSVLPFACPFIKIDLRSGSLVFFHMLHVIREPRSNKNERAQYLDNSSNGLGRHKKSKKWIKNEALVVSQKYSPLMYAFLLNMKVVMVNLLKSYVLEETQ